MRGGIVVTKLQYLHGLALPEDDDRLPPGIWGSCFKWIKWI